MVNRKLILVTGAPRSATTPVGNILASTKHTLSLYEPLGPTGLRRIEHRFPMLENDYELTSDTLAELVQDLQHYRSRGLKSQQRGDKFSYSRMIFGSRTLHSFRMARLQPWARNIIWKDPHAIMLAPDVANMGVDVVVTVRRALAHAASYKRLNWVSQARLIYPRWARKYGTCSICEAALSEADDVVTSAALIWRMSYLPIIRTNSINSIHLITSDKLISDERKVYKYLFRVLGLQSTKKTETLFSENKNDTRLHPSKNVTHDWNRTVSAANSYWKEIMSEKDIDSVSKLTSDVEAIIYR